MKAYFSTTGRLQAPSDAFVERSRRDRPKTAILAEFFFAPPWFWRKSAPKFAPGGVLSCVSYGSNRPGTKRQTGQLLRYFESITSGVDASPVCFFFLKPFVVLFCLFIYLMCLRFLPFFLADLQLPSGVRGQDAAVRLVGKVCRSP